jgi:hypothetical protein
MKKAHNNWDEFTNGVEEVFDDLGSCIDDAINIKETKTGVVKSLFNLGGSLTKLAFKTTSAVVTNVPKAVVAVADIKRELVDGIEEGVREFQKQQKEDALDEKIKQLKLKTSSQKSLTFDD